MIIDVHTLRCVCGESLEGSVYPRRFTGVTCEENNGKGKSRGKVLLTCFYLVFPPQRIYCLINN